jgi:hypothetical protein
VPSQIVTGTATESTTNEVLTGQVRTTQRLLSLLGEEGDIYVVRYTTRSPALRSGQTIRTKSGAAQQPTPAPPGS